MGYCKLENKQDVDDFLNGVCILGTGGGGKLDYGRRFLYPLIETKKLGWVDVEEIDDEDNVACVWYMGSVAPVKIDKDIVPEKQEQYPLIRALEILEKQTGEKINAIVAMEMGASNTAAAVQTGAILGLPVLDGDYAGRAVPEIVQMVPFLYGYDLHPFAICDEWGNELYVQKTYSGHTAEAIGKMVSVVTKSMDSSALCGHCGIVLKGKDVKKILIRNTLSKALALGRSISRARSKGQDVFLEAIENLKAFPLFEGEVSEMNWKSEQGYMFGYAKIIGTGKWEGKTCKIWYKNENHLLWVDGQLRCSSPDLICGIYTDSGIATNNSTLKVGDRVSYFGVPNPDYRKPEILPYMEPKYFGFDEAYVPIEELYQKR